MTAPRHLTISLVSPPSAAHLELKLESDEQTYSRLGSTQVRDLRRSFSEQLLVDLAVTLRVFVALVTLPYLMTRTKARTSVGQTLTKPCRQIWVPMMK